MTRCNFYVSGSDAIKLSVKAILSNGSIKYTELSKEDYDIQMSVVDLIVFDDSSSLEIGDELFCKFRDKFYRLTVFEIGHNLDTFVVYNDRRNIEEYLNYDEAVKAAFHHNRIFADDLRLIDKFT